MNLLDFALPGCYKIIMKLAHYSWKSRKSTGLLLLLGGTGP